MAVGKLVTHTFLAKPCADQVSLELQQHLIETENELRNYFNALPNEQKIDSRTGELTNDFVVWCGLREPPITWRDGKNEGIHVTGLAIDLDPSYHPYIATHTGSVYGGKPPSTKQGEQPAPALVMRLREQATQVYDRAIQFTVSPTAATDVSIRRIGESTSDVYDRFLTASTALMSYFDFVFKADAPTISRPSDFDVADPAKVPDSQLEVLIQQAERRPREEALAYLQGFMTAPEFLSTHPNWPLSPEAQYYRILRDYEIVRLSMPRGVVAMQKIVDPTTRKARFVPVLDPPATANPAQGFLSLRKEVVVALCSIGGLRWGACDLGSVKSGNIAYFDTFVNHVFLGKQCGDGINKELQQRLISVETLLQNKFASLSEDERIDPHSGQKTNSFTVWCGVRSEYSGWRNGGPHLSGSAIDIDSLFNPYIVTRTRVAGGDILGGEKAGSSFVDIRRQVVAIYDRAVQFVNTSSTPADLSARGANESTSVVYDRFKLVSDSVAKYFQLAFKIGVTHVNRPPVDGAEHADLATLLAAIPEAERKPQSDVMPTLTSLMTSTQFTTAHPGWPFDPAAQYVQLLRDYEIMRTPLVFGTPSRRPASTRNPALGFLDIRREVVEALCDPATGHLRWGACDFGISEKSLYSENGDMMHFDLGAQAPAPTNLADAFRELEQFLQNHMNDLVHTFNELAGVAPQLGDFPASMAGIVERVGTEGGVPKEMIDSITTRLDALESA